MTATFYVGDAIEVMSKLPEKSVDLILTSPPFLALRSYLPADHPDKALEGGSQATPGEYIDWLIDVVEACDRVLAPHGSMCIELGDTYAGSGGGGGDYLEGGWREGQAQFAGSAASMKESNAAHWRQKNPPKTRQRNDGGQYGNHPQGGTKHNLDIRPVKGSTGWPLAKSLSLIPELFRLTLVYGTNPLTGRQTERWRLRNVVRWVRPNPPVGALCVDAETEALTLDGWKTHDQLVDGDLVASYDLKTDSIRFLPAKFVRYEVEGESMVAIDKRTTSQRLTEWHRCLVRTRKGGVQVKLAQDLTNESQTLLCAPFDDVAGPAPVTTERAALLGWYVAEGTPHHRQARIVQSVSANPEKVEQIRRLLDRDGADYRQTFYTRPGSTMATFTIKGELADWLNLHHKRLPMSYVTTWPQAQAQALFDALIDGDGHRRKSRGVLFHQQNEAVADAVQVLAIRLGYRASKLWQPSMKLWQITMSMAPIQDRRWTKLRKWDGEGIPREVYTGTIWCPQVETGFWLARRNGKTFITGNSDKFRPATSELMVFCKSAKRYFDLDAVREPHKSETRRHPCEHGHYDQHLAPSAFSGYEQCPGGADIPLLESVIENRSCSSKDGLSVRNMLDHLRIQHRRRVNKDVPMKELNRVWDFYHGPVPLKAKRGDVGTKRRATMEGGELGPYTEGMAGGAPPLDWWNIPPGGFSGAHYAVWPPELLIKPIKAMCPEKVCLQCGEPSRRITEPTPEYGQLLGKGYVDHAFDAYRGLNKQGVTTTAERVTTGFSDCGHDDWRPGLVLDPFGGSGTTALVATGHGRDCWLIDLDERNYELALQRVGPFILERAG